MDNIKITEVTVSRSGTLPTGYFQNVKPSFSMTAEVRPGESPEYITETCNNYLCHLFEMEDKKAKAELLQKRYKNFRWYHKNGKKYVSVTTVLGWGDRYNKFKKFTDDELAQYASQGNIIEALMTEYLKTGKWIDPNNTSKLQDDVAMLNLGGMGFNWDKCTHKTFIEKFGKKIGVIENYQGTVYNDDYEYAGTYDILGEFDGKRSIIDIKRNYFNMQQLAAYAMCLKDVEQLVIFKVGPTENKCGYYKPITTTDIQKEFDGFLAAREQFRQKFGI
ncbi:hypothetical protein LCGC14_2216970 [marine sediment metagenome]|uniref:PD-(D/E)XK endonuclease-like domain-containing protein n=1 Tax=marine sediment metagenome TaxID=412755 RepID=A0A0F9FPV8_9ZZZZ